jgi:hypothetical protein
MMTREKREDFLLKVMRREPRRGYPVAPAQPSSPSKKIFDPSSSLGDLI